MNVDCYGIMICAGVGKPWQLVPETFTTGKEASAFYVDHLSSEGNLFRIIEINITLVKEYMEHEDNTFENARSKDTMTLVSLYPELKSDSLVKEQISVYNKNNAQIKKLKEKKIDVSVAKWWLYFGK